MTQFGGGGGTSCSSASSVCTFSLVQFCIIAHHRASTCRHADRNLFYNQLTCQLWRVSTFSFHKQFLYTCHNSPVGRSVGVGRCGSTAELDKDVSKVFSVVVTLHLFNLLPETCHRGSFAALFDSSRSCFRGIIPEVSSFKNKHMKPR